MEIDGANERRFHAVEPLPCAAGDAAAAGAPTRVLRRQGTSQMMAPTAPLDIAAIDQLDQPAVAALSEALTQRPGVRRLSVASAVAVGGSGPALVAAAAEDRSLYVPALRDARLAERERLAALAEGAGRGG